jgi:hypothetical protein
MCYFGFGDRGGKKKICNSECLYFHVCDIENVGENLRGKALCQNIRHTFVKHSRAATAYAERLTVTVLWPSLSRSGHTLAASSDGVPLRVLEGSGGL